MNTNFAQINVRDVIKSALTAAIAAVLLVVYKLVAADNFDLFSIDWVSTGHLIANSASAAFIADLGRRFFTDADGKLFGSI